MGRRSHRSRRPGSIGLFFFQDIIFLTIGIVILVSAFLSLTKRVSYLSSRDEFNDKALDERVNQSVVTLSYWNQGRWLLSRSRPDAVAGGMGDDRISAGSSTASVPGVEAEEVFRACGGLWALDRYGSELVDSISLKQREVSKGIGRLLELERDYQSDKQLLVEMEANRNRVLVAPEADQSLRQPIVLLLSGKRAKVYLLGRANRSIVLNTPLTSVELVEQFGGMPSDEMHLIVLVKPSGIEHFRPLRAWLLDAGFAVGYEPVSEFYEFSSQQEQLMEMIR